MFYFSTSQRTVSWQDSGTFQWRVLVGDYTGDLGLALAHPLYIAGGRCLAAVSRQHLPLLLNCFSGLGMAVALANLAVLASVMTGRRWIGLLAAGMLATAHTCWWLSTVAEVYTWSVAGLTGELLCLVALLARPRWTWLAALAFLSGLGLCVHNFALLPLPVYAAVAAVLAVRRKLPAWSLATAVAAYLAGAGLYAGMTIRLAVASGDWLGAVRSALTGRYGRQVLNVAAALANWKYNAGLSGMNFVGLLLPLAAIGWVRFRRSLGTATAAALGAITVIHVVFFIRYPVPDQVTFILPTMTMVAIAAAVGLGALADVSRRWRNAAAALCLLSLVWQPVLYAAAPLLVRRLVPGIRRERQLAYRDELRYWLVPWKHDERSAERFASAALAEAEPDGVIVADSTSVDPLRVYQELHYVHPGVTVQFAGAPLPSYDGSSEEFRRAVGERCLYAVSDMPGHAPKKLLQDAAFERTGSQVLFAVRWLSP